MLIEQARSSPDLRLPTHFGLYLFTSPRGSGLDVKVNLAAIGSELLASIYRERIQREAADQRLASRRSQ
jgi:hypothetical protein